MFRPSPSAPSRPRLRAVFALGLAALVSGASGASAQSRPAPPSSDAKAVEIAGRVMETLGGETAWNNTRYLRFTFAVDREGKTVASRDHLWDKWNGRYRLDATDKDGKKVTTLMNVNTKQGRARREGQELAGEELAKQLESAYGAWVNDTYWLLMPYKMMDPVVVLKHDGEAKEGDAAWDKVRLTFEGVGLTPKDKYWAFVNRKTGLVDRWDFVLKGESKPPSTFTWEGWKPYGKIQLASEHKSKDGTRIHFPTLEVPASVPDSRFTDF